MLNLPEIYLAAENCGVCLVNRAMQSASICFNQVRYDGDDDDDNDGGNREHCFVDLKIF